MPDSKSDLGNSTGFSDSELEGLADLCAVGSVPIPFDLPTSELQELLLMVGQRRRKRLLKLFAAAIARDILRDQHN